MSHNSNSLRAKTALKMIYSKLIFATALCFMATTLFYFNRDAVSSHRYVPLRRELSLHAGLGELPDKNSFPPFLEENWDLLYDKVKKHIDSLTSKDDKSKLMGGILRLAFHDAMDFNDTDVNKGGSDGCIDDSSSENKLLLKNYWSADSGNAKWFKGLYDTNFKTKMSVADFWVASAIAVLQRAQTYTNDVYFKFKWGRQDADEATCTTIKAQKRFPKMDSQHGCKTLKDIHNYLGLTWPEVVDLMGFHTLGVDENGYFFTDSVENSLNFDKKYYKMIKNGGWSRTLPAGHPRSTTNSTYFGWHYAGGNTRKMVMYPADLCLYYEEEDIEEMNCCANIKNTNNCVDSNSAPLPECTKLPETNETRILIDEYVNGTDSDVVKFFHSFNTVFFKITSNGYDTNHLHSPWENRTQVICQDMCQFVNDNAVTQNCSKFESDPDNCKTYAKYCPATCGVYQPESATHQYFPEKCYYENLTPDGQKEIGCHGAYDVIV